MQKIYSQSAKKVARRRPVRFSGISKLDPPRPPVAPYAGISKCLGRGKQL